MTAIVCMALSAAGLVVALLRGSRKRFRSALRWAALALVPTGLYLTGLITVFDRIGRALGSWATDLVFDPRVWTGVVMLGVAVLVLLATGLGRGRGRGRDSGEKQVKPAKQAKAAPGGGGVPAVTAKQQSTDDLGDFSDIEDILKRRGI